MYGIALPVLGHVECIGTALRSLRAQPVAYQLALMDATPDDSVQTVVRDYRELLSYTRHGPDAGQAAAIAEGWAHTGAPILAWLCADDYYFPDTLAAVRQVFNTRPDIDVVYGDTAYVNEQGSFLGYFPEISSTVSALPRSCCISQPSCFVRREALARIGGLATDLHYVMDWDLWTRLYRAGAHFHYLPRPLSVCRLSPDTKTASRSRARYHEINAHLRRFSPPLTRLRSLLGFYYQDLLTHRQSWHDHLVYRLLSGLVALKRQLRPEQEIVRERSLYGLTRRSNIVHDRAVVWLPWFAETDRCRATICVDRALTLVVEGAGQRSEVRTVHDGDSYHASVILEPIQQQCLQFTIQAVDRSEAWQLKRIDFQPM